MRFSIYKRFEIEVLRQDGRWIAFRRSNGMRLPDADLVIPSNLAQSELAVYLDDVFHEYASPGDEITQLG